GRADSPDGLRASADLGQRGPPGVTTLTSGGSERSDRKLPIVVTPCGAGTLLDRRLRRRGGSRRLPMYVGHPLARRALVLPGWSRSEARSNMPHDGQV